jgi:cation:H+ antiporter
MIDMLIFVLSMTVLIYGADIVIDQAEKISFHFDISPFIIGATVVALGTSLPEMAVSMKASYIGKSDIAVSNIIGSTIFNISLVLGVVFLIIKKPKTTRDIFGTDSLWIVLPVIVFLLMSIDGNIGFVDGVLFVCLMGAYIWFLLDSHNLEAQTQTKEKFQWLASISMLTLGFVAVIGGANIAVGSATNIAVDFGVDEWLIGIFLIAFGTSLPELIVAIKATKKSNIDMAIGAIIGSNMANFSMVLGFSAMINPLKVDISLYYFDIMSAVAVSVVLVFIVANKLYTKSAGLSLLIILALVIQNSIRSI